MKKMELYRKIIASMPNGQEIKVHVYKAGRAIELRFFDPNNGLTRSILVHPINRDTPDGWMHEINNQCFPSISISKWRDDY